MTTNWNDSDWERLGENSLLLKELLNRHDGDDFQLVGDLRKVVLLGELPLPLPARNASHEEVCIVLVKLPSSKAVNEVRRELYERGGLPFGPRSIKRQASSKFSTVECTFDLTGLHDLLQDPFGLHELFVRFLKQLVLLIGEAVEGLSLLLPWFHRERADGSVAVGGLMRHSEGA